MVESFATYALSLLGASVTQDFDGYKIQVTNLPKHLQVKLY